MFVLEVILDRSVGGERMLMSMAVPRRIGTSGVSSMEMRGLEDLEGDDSEPILNASIRPGLTVMLHSSGSKLSQFPLSDHAKIDAIALEDLAGWSGTVR